MFFVELTANKEDLIARVDNESRSRYKKLTDPVIMEKITQSMSIYSIPFVDSLKINTSNLSPEESVSTIISNL